MPPVRSIAARALMPELRAVRPRSRRPYLAHLGAFGDVHCYLVDGEWIRNVRDVDFTNGAHHLTRAYVPPSEIWIDDAAAASERGFIVAHEAHELTLMRSGMGYDDAHERALALERSLRSRRRTQR